MKAKMNEVKGREPFRPVAPAVIAEAADEHFDLVESPLWSTMAGAARVKPDAIAIIPAAVHHDGTARPQVVKKCESPLFHALLTRFGELTGTPILLNTSFNSASEPIVESPEDAFDAAKAMGLDVLYVGDLCIEFQR